MDNLVIIGWGSHAKVLVDIIHSIPNIKLKGYVDKKETESDIEYLGDDTVINHIKNKGITHFIVGIGDNKIRKKCFKKAIESGLIPYTIIGPHSYISRTAKIGKGCVIMPNTTIQTNVEIGDNCIINTSSSIDHDCIIKSHTHIASGVTLSGSTNVGEETFIGTGASVKDCIKIGEKCIIGAGAAVIRDVPNNLTVVGVPAKDIR